MVSVVNCHKHFFQFLQDYSKVLYYIVWYVFIWIVICFFVFRRVNSEKGGEVFYQPDAADDWDEEDPDDDLDIWGNCCVYSRISVGVYSEQKISVFPVSDKLHCIVVDCIADIFEILSVSIFKVKWILILMVIIMIE